MNHPVLARAKTLSRRIYASLPWGFRVANLFLKLASGYIDAFGRLVYAEMIKAGVEGMPPVNGEPAQAWVDRVQGPKGPDKLPRGYGAEFGKRIYAFLLSKTHSVDLAEEIMSRLMMDIARGKLHFKGGYDVKQSEGLIFQQATRAILDVKREQHGRKNDRMAPDSLTDDVGDTIDLADPSSFQHLDSMLPRSEMGRVMHDLQQIHPKAVEWFEAKLEGLSGRELAEQWGVTAPRVHQLEEKIIPGVKLVLQKYLRDAA